MPTLTEENSWFLRSGSQVFLVTIWIRNNWIGASQLDARQPIRRGKKNEQGDEQKPSRPLKIVLDDKIYHNKVPPNYDKLGEAEDLFKNISISPDYNKDEREKIRALAAEAKKKIRRAFKLCLLCLWLYALGCLECCKIAHLATGPIGFTSKPAMGMFKV